MRTAFSSMAWNTGSSAPGEELTIFSTSEVAVSRWRASSSSRVSWSNLSCKFGGDARLVGALRALDLFARRPFIGCPLPPRRCMSPPGGSRRCYQFYGSSDDRAMSALGQKQTYAVQKAMSALGQKQTYASQKAMSA